MNWDHAVIWGRGVRVSVSDIGQVGQTDVVVGQPELKKQKTSVLLFGLGSSSTKSPMCGKQACPINPAGK